MKGIQDTLFENNEEDFWEDAFTCPVCGFDKCVPPIGSRNAKILVVGEFPGDTEVKKGKPFVGASGAILTKELARVGISKSRLRICNLWPHPKNKNKQCFNHGLKTTLKEAKDKEAILLLGSDTVSFFCNKGVSKVAGLKVKADLLSAPIIMTSPNPASIFHGGIGEFRLSLSKLENEIEDFLE